MIIDAFTMKNPIFKFAFIFLIFNVKIHNTFPIFFIILPLSFVLMVISVFSNAKSLNHTLIKLPFINFCFSKKAGTLYFFNPPFHYSFPMFFVIHIRSNISTCFISSVLFNGNSPNKISIFK